MQGLERLLDPQCYLNIYYKGLLKYGFFFLRNTIARSSLVAQRVKDPFVTSVAQVTVAVQIRIPGSGTSAC